MARGRLALLVAVALLPLGVAAAETGTLRTDSRAPYVHRLSLYDSEATVIAPKSESAAPYSPAATCGSCHDGQVITRGWHFDAPNPAAPAGRPGEPWILTDLATGTQLPASSRPWPGTWRPADAGLTPWQFTLTFGSYTPGGGLGDKYSQKPEDPNAKWKTSGRLEIDCLGCHNGDPGHDLTEWGKQIASQNLKWAPVAAAGLAIVRGSAKEGGGGGDIIAEADPAAAEHATANVKVAYDPRRFDANDRAFFNIRRKPAAGRCYFCHSFHRAGEGSSETAADGDVHLARGMTCADCHRNGLDHRMARGDEAAASCRGCHESGRIGAPRPIHSGLPVSHLKKLACTACHAGLPPGDQPQSVRTSRAHGLGVPSMVRREDVPPFIVEPVFVRGADGKIAPHRMIWPAFWGRMKGEAVSPVALDDAAQEALGTKGLKSEDWKPLTEEQIAKGLKALSAKKDGEAVYVCGGKLHRLGADGKAAASDHPAAAPYSWPVGHDVRPAAQSLGSGGCTDCHAPKAGFFYASVAPPSPARVGAPARRMYEYQGQNPDDLKAWNATARYRRVWIWINLAAAGVLACVFINFSVMGLGAIFRAIFMKKPHRVEQ